ncbi:hypothetical protein [Catelliglobosispora koreensis]|uniref:hypothetical protein n=1 Tax=Catelliglobosispora koreensis TaxID=129052 RepID=UPI000365B016|nr:hypothetical protein [Catelliglobosispora koreensis]
MKQIIRGTAAVIAGIVTIVVLSNGTDYVLEAIGVYPSWTHQQTYGFHTPWMVGLALAYRTIAAVAGGYVAARIGRTRTPVIVLAVIGTVGGAAGIFAAGDMAPLWYSILIPALSLPAILIGARLASRTRSS